jgi:hypothetical protein
MSDIVQLMEQIDVVLRRVSELVTTHRRDANGGLLCGPCRPHGSDVRPDRNISGKRSCGVD